MKKLFFALLTIAAPGLSEAEPWKDYSLSKEVTELVVVSVKSNYFDDYLVQIEDTWARAMALQQEMGDVVDYGIWVANNADSPNVFLTITYKDMAAMAGSEAKYDELMAKLRAGGMDEKAQDKTAKGYEDMREMVDYKILRQVQYK